MWKWLLEALAECEWNETGNEYDWADGKLVKRPKPEESSGFTTYDGSKGHCGLCGRLTCDGRCFK